MDIAEFNPGLSPDKKERMKQIKVGISIGSGGVYSTAGLGVIEVMEQNGFNIPYIGGASGGALVSALYFLEGNAVSAREKFLQKLPDIQSIKLSLFRKAIPGVEAQEIIRRFLDDRDWKDGKITGACFGAAYQDTKDAVILTEKSGVSLVDSILASISLKMIEPVVTLDGRIVAHGGDTECIEGLKNIGADIVIDVSPNLNEGIIGKIARMANDISSAAILKGDYLAAQNKIKTNKPDYAIHPSLSLKPFISPLNYSLRNTEFMISRGKELTEKHIETIKNTLHNS